MTDEYAKTKRIVARIGLRNSQARWRKTIADKTMKSFIRLVENIEAGAPPLIIEDIALLFIDNYYRLHHGDNKGLSYSGFQCERIRTGKSMEMRKDIKEIKDEWTPIFEKFYQKIKEDGTI